MTELPAEIRQYIAEHPTARHPNCWTCNIPETNDLNFAFKSNIKIKILRDFLIESKHYDSRIATEDKLRAHFRRNHHLEDA